MSSPSSHQHIVVATDFSPPATAAWTTTVARDSGLSVRTVLRNDGPWREIVALAAEENANMVVLGTHGRSGLKRSLLGSIADRVVRLAPCPVLTVRVLD